MTFREAYFDKTVSALPYSLGSRMDLGQQLLAALVDKVHTMPFSSAADKSFELAFADLPSAILRAYDEVEISSALRTMGLMVTRMRGGYIVVVDPAQVLVIRHYMETPPPPRDVPLAIDVERAWKDQYRAERADEKDLLQKIMAATGIERCRLISQLLIKNPERLDLYVCQGMAPKMGLSAEEFRELARLGMMIKGSRTPNFWGVLRYLMEARYDAKAA